MRQFGYLRAIPYSFGSRRLYQDIAFRWSGIGLLYLYILMLILGGCILAGLVSRYYAVGHEQVAARIYKQFLQSETGPLTLHQQITRAINIAAQFPELNWDGKKLGSTETMPTEIHDPLTKHALGIIDLTGKTQSLLHSDAFFLLTADRLAMRGSHGEEKVYYLQEIAKGKEEDFSAMVQLLGQIPTVTLEDNRLASTVAQPYNLTITANGQKTTVATLDTTKDATSLQATENLHFGAESVLYRPHTGEEQRYYYHDINDTNAKALISGTLERSQGIVWIVLLILLPICAALMMLLYFIYTLLFSIAGLFAANVLSIPIEYKALLRITAVSFTPVLIIGLLSLYFTTGMTTHIPTSLWAMIIFAYIMFGLACARNDSGPEILKQQP